jgi:hypothetical protein
MARQLKKGKTPVGEALYPRLTTPDVYNGQPVGYSIQMRFSDESTKALIDEITKEWENAKLNDDAVKGKKFANGTIPYLGYREEDDGSVTFKFKTKHEYTDKETGEVKKRVVPVFDTKGKLLDVNLGNGSKVIVAYQMNPYFTSNKNYGVTLYLDAVQVIDLIEYNGGGTAASFGFDVQDNCEEDGIPF